jgi:hypothetical protein
LVPLIGVLSVLYSADVMGQEWLLGAPEPGYQEVRIHDAALCREYNGVAGSRVDVSAVLHELTGSRERLVAHGVKLVALLPPCTAVFHAVETDALRIERASRSGEIRLNVSDTEFGDEAERGEIRESAKDGYVAYCVGKGCRPAESLFR